MAGKDQSRNYLSFLLRIWRLDGDSWRFSLEDPASGSRSSFTSLGLLLDYLYRRIAATGRQIDDRER